MSLSQIQGLLHGLEDHQECGEIPRSCQTGNKCFGKDRTKGSTLRTVSVLRFENIFYIRKLTYICGFMFYL